MSFIRILCSYFNNLDANSIFNYQQSLNNFNASIFGSQSNIFGAQSAAATNRRAQNLGFLSGGLDKIHGDATGQFLF